MNIGENIDRRKVPGGPVETAWKIREVPFTPISYHIDTLVTNISNVTFSSFSLFFSLY